MPKIRTISAEDLKKFLEKDGLLFTSQDLAKMLGVTEGALRKQRSKNRSIFKFAKLGGRIRNNFYYNFFSNFFRNNIFFKPFIWKTKKLEPTECIIDL